MSNFLFPIETTARELDHKIMMAILSADKDRIVYVGDQQIVRNLSYFLKGGVFYGKHLFGKPEFSDTKYYKRLKDRNFNVVHLNEEGAVWPGTEKVWSSLLEQSERPSVLNSSDYMAVWGQWQKSFDDSREEHNTNIVVTGHPRFDMYAETYRDYFKDDIAKIADEFGDFILVNTAFSYANNGNNGVQFIFKPTLSYDVNNIEHREYRFKRWKTQMYSVADIVDLVNKISLKYPDKKIVLRPHPSENTEYYENIFQNIDNIFVVYKGTVSPWILACKVLIHNGCTTAIEATLASKPVVNFRTTFDENFDIYLANICGVTMDKADDVLNYIDEVYRNKIVTNMPKDSKANSLFHNFECQNTSKNVMKLLNNADKTINKDNIIDSQFIVSFSGVFHNLYLFLKYSYLTFKGDKNAFVDYKKRFIEFDKSDIENKVKNMSKILGKEVKLQYINKYLFSVKI